MLKGIIRTVIALSIVILISLSGLAAEKKIDHAERAYNAGIKAYSAGEYQKAVYAFQNSIKYNEKLYKSYYMLGLSLLMNEEFAAAEKSLLSTIDMFPKEWKAQVLLGEYYSSKKEYETAIEYYNKAFESKNMTKSDKEKYQEKLNAIQAERDALWRVSEEEKDKILKQISLPGDFKTWRPVVVEKHGSELHLSYLPKNDELAGGKWKTMLDIRCKTPQLGGFREVNQKLADDFRAKGSDLTTIDQQAEARTFETKLVKKPVVYIIGRISKTPVGYCLMQMMQQKTKFKDKDTENWASNLKSIIISSNTEE